MVIFTIISIASLTSGKVIANPGASHSIYGCIIHGPSGSCEPMINPFSTRSTTAHTEYLSTINTTKFNPIDGVFGKPLVLHGSRQQYVTN